MKAEEQENILARLITSMLDEEKLYQWPTSINLTLDNENSSKQLRIDYLMTIVDIRFG